MHGLGLFDPSNYSILIKRDSLKIYSSKEILFRSILEKNLKH
jgi:hypothetical protein